MSNGGSFPATPKVEFMRDGRLIRLLEDFKYIDPKGSTWTAKRGAQADGASIPRAAWTIMGGPLDGAYRDAAIIHDFYCSTRHKPWKKVHRMFFDAMITSKVVKAQAMLMYAAVYVGGPRWSEMDSHNVEVYRTAIPSHMKDEGRARASTIDASKLKRNPVVSISFAKKAARLPVVAKKIAKKAPYRYHFDKKDMKSIEELTPILEDMKLESLEAHLDRITKRRSPQYA